MGCPSIDCTNLTESNTITVLPDVVGIGILLSFLLTAALASLSVVFSYFVGALPDEWLNAADFSIVHKWRRCEQCKERYDKEVNEPRDAEKVTKPSCNHNDPEIADRRREGLNTFILTLSDQQLVTGLAMMIAALVRHCSLSYYEFSVVANLAWLSSTTHLTTLAVLQPYLQTRPVLRYVRIIGIFCNLALLLYFTLVNGAAAAAHADGSASIQCVMNDLHHLLRHADFSTWVSVWFLLDSHWAAISEVIGLRVEIWKRLTRRYCRWLLRNAEPTHSSSHTNEGETLRRFVSWTNEDFKEWGRWHFGLPRKEFIWSRRWEKTESVSQLPQSPEHRKLPLDPVSLFLPLFAALDDYGKSAFSAIPIFLWSLSYGITGTILSRQLKPNVDGSENEVDFGQIVPLFLLLLPLLAALETYIDIHRKNPPETLWSHVIEILNSKAESSKSITKPTETRLAKAEVAVLTEQPEKTAPEKTDTQAASLDYPVEACETNNVHDNLKAPLNPYRKLKNRTTFYLVCVYFLGLELSTGISTGLSPDYLILWATSKGLSYLNMVVNRLFFLWKVHRFAFDLPGFCRRHPKDPSGPGEPSPGEALKILKPMLSDPKHERASRFELDDIENMRQLLRSLREKASKNIADKAGRKGVDDKAEDKTKSPGEEIV